LEDISKTGEQVAHESAVCPNVCREPLEERPLSDQMRLDEVTKRARTTAHDFNNALGVILGRVQLALEEAKDPFLTKQLKTVERTVIDIAGKVREFQIFLAGTASSDHKSVTVVKSVEKPSDVI